MAFQPIKRRSVSAQINRILLGLLSQLISVPELFSARGIFYLNQKKTTTLEYPLSPKIRAFSLVGNALRDRENGGTERENGDRSNVAVLQKGSIAGGTLHCFVVLQKGHACMQKGQVGCRSDVDGGKWRQGLRYWTYPLSPKN